MLQKMGLWSAYFEKINLIAIKQTMCGRFSTAKPHQFEKKFKLKNIPMEFVERYNICPSQLSAVVTNIKPDEIQMFRWGLIPPWAKDPKIGFKMINARAETVNEKPSFKKPFQSQRCLILADGFYEWRRDDPKSKIPFRIALKDDEPFAFAGVWELWKDHQGQGVYTFTIITTEANALVAKIHNRMPVIIDSKDKDLWLDIKQPPDKIKKLLIPFESQQMIAYQISTLVNSPSNDVQQIMNPLS